jgi:glycosyltransferase involved in cell wall biosynthesis
MVSKYTEKDITIVVPSYNNLDYLKLLYQSVRDVSTDVELVIYSDGSTDGTKEWLDTLTDSNAMTMHYDERVGHTFLYDWGFEKSERAIIGILHADMVVHKNFFSNILKHINEGVAVSGTCVEPPLHPPGGEKHIFDAGMYPNDFNMDRFNGFCEGLDIDSVKHGIFAPWFLLREEYKERIGTHDAMFAPYGYEDADLFTRMALKQFTFIQSRDALVYHFTQRGHKWTKGVGIENDGYKEQMNHTRREYVRKFGTDPLFDTDHAPTPAPKYDIGFVIQNGNKVIMQYLEPYCSTLYIDYKEGELEAYVAQEHSTYNITDRIKPFGAEKMNDILVSFDANKLTQHSVNVLMQLPLIIQDTNDTGTFEYDIFTIHINKLNEVIVC